MKYIKYRMETPNPKIRNQKHGSLWNFAALFSDFKKLLGFQPTAVQRWRAIQLWKSVDSCAVRPSSLTVSGISECTPLKINILHMLPQNFNMEPENDGFQKESPFPGTSFQVLCEISRVLSWRFGSNHFPFFSWVMAVGEPAVNLPGCTGVPYQKKKVNSDH